MGNIKFNDNELNKIGLYELPGIYSQPPSSIPQYNTPITPKENMIRFFKGESLEWLPNQVRDNNELQPKCMPDALARSKGGVDWFGIEWQYEPLSRAAMVKPGTRRLSDITNWEEEIIFPDLSLIDWEKDFNENYSHTIPNERFTCFTIVNGLFERLADLTSMEDAFVYLLTEKEDLTNFFEKLTDWHIELIKIAKKYYYADMILLHDDMGAQKSAFFSPQLYDELLVPHYQRITEAAHKEGMFIALHSCGNVLTHIPYFIKAGFDGWQGQDSCNDKGKIMEEYGDKIAQLSNLVIPANVSNEEAIKIIHDKVDTIGSKGRYACRLRDENPNRDIDLADELYRYSRIKYYKG